jgi:hypothetical protein
MNKNVKLILLGTLIVPVIMSCKNNVESPHENVLSDAQSSNEAVLAVSAVYSSRSVSFDRPNGTYTLAQGTSDFGNISAGWNESRAYTTGNTCQIKLLKNALSSAGGMIAKYDIADGSEYETTFKVKFHADFEYCTGGKLGPGFFIGNGAAGGGGADGTGGSLRLVWHKHPSTGAVYFQAYAYHADQAGDFGTTYGTYPSSGSITKNQWYTIKLYVKSNTGTDTNGRLKLIIDGTTVVDRAMRWTTNDTYRLIKNMEFATFRGGGSADYMSSTDSYIYFNDMSWTRLAN